MRINSYISIGIGSLLFYFCILNFVCAAPKVKEYHIKARYIDGFISFIQWPVDTLTSESPIKLCILGDNPFGKTLEILANKHNGEGSHASHRRIISYLQRGEDITHCHLLYISVSEESYVQQVLTQVQGKPILTVSSLKNFAVEGGMIEFYVRDNKIRFLIAPKKLRNAKLQPDANLLRVADLVTD